MDYTKESLDKLTENPENIRKHPDKQVLAMIKSIEQFGQIRPIVVDEKGVILAGHCLFVSMRQMGLKEATILKMKKLTSAQKSKLMIADNKIYELGIIDYAFLDKKLEELGKLGDFDIPGFDEDTLKELFVDDGLDKKIESVSDYGRINDITINGIDGKEVKLAEIDEQQVVIGNKDVRVEYSASNVAKPYVVCKKCDTKIWL